MIILRITIQLNSLCLELNDSHFKPQALTYSSIAQSVFMLFREVKDKKPQSLYAVSAEF